MSAKITRMAWGLWIVCLVYTLTACNVPTPAPQIVDQGRVGPMEYAGQEPPAVSPTLQAPGSKGTPVVTIEIERSYVLLSRQEMIDRADEIFLGQVQSISPARWNQDSGEYWEETTHEGNGLTTFHAATPYYEVEFSVIRSIVSTSPSHRQLTVTIQGKSPVDEQMPASSAGPVLTVVGDELQLHVGERVIVFVQEGVIPWRDPSKPIRLVQSPNGTYFDIGTRSVLAFFQEPKSSLFYQGDDGLYYSPEDAAARWEPFSLEDLERLVEARRGIAPQ